MPFGSVCVTWLFLYAGERACVLVCVFVDDAYESLCLLHSCVDISTALHTGMSCGRAPIGHQHLLWEAGSTEWINLNLSMKCHVRFNYYLKPDLPCCRVFFYLKSHKQTLRLPLLHMLLIVLTGLHPVCSFCFCTVQHHHLHFWHRPWQSVLFSDACGITGGLGSKSADCYYECQATGVRGWMAAYCKPLEF